MSEKITGKNDREIAMIDELAKNPATANFDVFEAHTDDKTQRSVVRATTTLELDDNYKIVVNIRSRYDEVKKAQRYDLVVNSPMRKVGEKTERIKIDGKLNITTNSRYTLKNISELMVKAIGVYINHLKTPAAVAVDAPVAPLRSIKF